MDRPLATEDLATQQPLAARLVDQLDVDVGLTRAVVGVALVLDHHGAIVDAHRLGFQLGEAGTARLQPQHLERGRAQSARKRLLGPRQVLTHHAPQLVGDGGERHIDLLLLYAVPDAGTVTGRPDVGERAAPLTIHLDGAVAEPLDAGICQKFGVGLDPGADHHDIGLVLALAGAHAGHPAIPQQRFNSLTQMEGDPLLAQFGFDVLGDLAIKRVGDDSIRQLDQAHLFTLMDQRLDHFQPDKAGADHHGAAITLVLHRSFERQPVGHPAQTEYPLLLQTGDGGHHFAGTGGDHQPIVAVGEGVAVVLHHQSLGSRVNAQHPMTNLDLDPLGGELLGGELGHVAGLLKLVTDEVRQAAGTERDHLGCLIHHDLGLFGQSARLGGRTHTGGFATDDQNSHCFSSQWRREGMPSLRSMTGKSHPFPRADQPTANQTVDSSPSRLTS